MGLSIRDNSKMIRQLVMENIITWMVFQLIRVNGMMICSMVME